jgi:D-glycero-alpha-D-manno-heptose 1-phosphate guanylyltransferase
MEAIILAGGRGTRLRSVVSDVPKPMAPINGTPFLEIILDLLISNGFKRVILSVGYKSENIIKHFGSNYKNLKLHYSIENKPLGTGGAIKQSIKMAKSEKVFILNGDTCLDVDYKTLLNKFKKTNNPIIVVKKVDDISRYGEVIFKNDVIKSFKSKMGANKSGYINTGCYIFPISLFDDLDIFFDKFSLEEEFFPYAIESKNIIFNAFVCNNSFIDIGIPSDFNKAQNFFDEK